MTMIFGIPIQALLGQLLVGLINGSFYAMLSLGLAVIFGLLRIINFAHGALYMLGAFIGYLLLVHVGIGYWPALVLVPLAVGLFGMAVERAALSRLYRIDPLYGLLFTFGMALVIEGVFRYLLRRLGKSLCRAGAACRRHQSRLHVPAQSIAAGWCWLPCRLHRHLAR